MFIIKYAQYVCGWFIVSKVIYRLFKHQNSKWKNNLISFLNAFLISGSIARELYYNIPASQNAYYYYSGVGYFLFDMKNYPVYSTYWTHHILSIVLIASVQNQTDIILDDPRNLLFVFEFGNLPMYLVYGLLTSIHNSRWKKNKLLKIFMIFEFIWFSFFRCVVPFMFIPNIHHLYKLGALIIILGSFKWAISILNNINKQ